MYPHGLEPEKWNQLMEYSVTRSVAKNTAIMMTTQIVTWVAGLVLLFFLPRYLGSKGYGELFLAMSIQAIFWTLVDYGSQEFIPKHISIDRENASSLFIHSASIRVILWLLSMILTIGLCIFSGYSWHLVLLILVLTTSNLWEGMSSLIRGCFLGFEEMKYPSVAAASRRFFLMATAVPALLLGAKEVVVVILMAASTLVSFLINAKYLKKILTIHFSIRIRTMVDLLKAGIPYFLLSFFGIVYYRIDAFMLSMMTPKSVVGWYGASSKLFDILMTFPLIFSTALLPVLSRQGKFEYNSMRNTTGKAIEYMVILGIPIAIALAFFAKDIVGLLFGLAQFSQSTIILQIFAAGIVLVYVDFILGGTTISVDRQRWSAFFSFLAIFVNVGLNFFMIPYFQKSMANGGVGAAIATDVTELFVMLATVFILPRDLFTRKLLYAVTKGLACGVTMALAILGGEALGFPWLAQVAIGSVVYGSSLILTKVFEPAEIERLLKAFSLKNLKGIFAQRSEASA